ncbi:hypothetical protein CES85_0878 [Ochrobactrum quorumnocens]|uniref:Uncharacterized protein n=1 Tax=Ochrobactrum quorumnocens TaxID=271865 RepID=A0A248ULI3_9HYPH|nr:hypothetical protein CES85_0878 [[Ochrobactrum] quorumnocens]
MSLAFFLALSRLQSAKPQRSAQAFDILFTFLIFIMLNGWR